MIKRALLVCVATVALTGCATLSTDEDVSEATAQSLPSLPESWAVDGAVPGEVRIGWIEAVGDPVLSKLVVEAQVNNPDIRAAAANLDAARALVVQARSALFPQVNANLNIDRTESPLPFALNQTQYQATAQAAWELDLWGRVRAGRNAAYASAKAVEADLLFAQYALAAGVASAYFASIEATQQVSVAQRNVDALTEIDRIVRVRYREGFASRQDTATTSADLQSARDNFVQARNAMRNARRALEILLGRYPMEKVALGEELPEAPPAPPAGLPSELLERRPDVIAAERRVASAFASLDQAKAAQLPQVVLTGAAGVVSTDIGDILSGDFIWSIVGDALQPVFDAGLRGAQEDEADANRRAAIAAYAATALEAFRDVEDNLDAVQVLADREMILETAAEDAGTAYALAQLQYQEGEVDLIDVLNFQQRLVLAESNLVSVRRQRIDQWVALNLALGGSWDSAPAPAGAQ
ncbi:MAG: TolC family protein [Erythrobacter sp.]|uniref:efflux transporter outer membrane subunit n=1 Tax=Erythrobacter sp. TaxID=1042 RepID=UPI002619CBFA|nr:TolC family protein [Erythrobacter sp.]MDJ0979121.1 TolC family protein [Erythrobacter sp.]